MAYINIDKTNLKVRLYFRGPFRGSMEQENREACKIYERNKKPWQKLRGSKKNSGLSRESFKFQPSQFYETEFED